MSNYGYYPEAYRGSYYAHHSSSAGSSTSTPTYETGEKRKERDSSEPSGAYPDQQQQHLWRNNNNNTNSVGYALDEQVAHINQNVLDPGGGGGRPKRKRAYSRKVSSHPKIRPPFSFSFFPNGFRWTERAAQ
jgi:hypothetical protein